MSSGAGFFCLEDTPTAHSLREVAWVLHRDRFGIAAEESADRQMPAFLAAPEPIPLMRVLNQGVPKESDCL
jgi:hypothetical protein